MLYILYPLDALLMIGMPIALAVWLARKMKAPWRLFGIGAVTFIGSQVVHIPLNMGLTAVFKVIWPSMQPQWWHLPFNAVVLGLTAGLCEEIARYVTYRWFAKKARHWRDALMLGAGHGGIEAILFGGYVALTFVNLVVLRHMDLTSLGLTGEALTRTQQEVATFWSAPAYLALLGTVERLFAIIIQVSLAVLVLQAFVRNDWRWLVVAIGYHLCVDAVTVVGAYSKWPAMLIEAALVPFALVSLSIILGLRQRGEPLIPPEPEPVLVSGASDTPRSASNRSADAGRQIEESRFV